MPNKEPTDPGGPTVRRAVPLPGSAPATALDALAPGEPAGSVRSSGSTEGPTAAPDSFEPAASARPEGPTAAVETSSSSVPDGGLGSTGAAGATAAGADNDPPESSTATGGDEEPPSGRPTKALRAAAALAGALLIAVPLIALGTGDDDKKDSGTGKAAWATIPDGEDPQNPGSYKGKSPVPEPTKDKKGSSDVDPDSGGQKAAEDEGGEGEESSNDSLKDDSSEGDDSSSSPPAPYSGPGPLLPDRLILVNAMTRMCIDVPGKGKGRVNGPVNQDPCAKDRRTDNQQWYMDVKKKTSKHGRLVVFRNAKDNLCLDLPGYGGVPGGTGVVEAPCDGTYEDNQLWWLDRRAGSNSWIRNYRSEQMCLDVHGKKYGSGGEDARLGVLRCNPKDDHEWRMS
ncbi:RICIN domain-containing protein [Streptomyces sp. GESEQ-35]|uniref:RICIN domain-containing protein n=1 Tax=Streptomyces sp. GESEQ-35 TaxID=2812657 RepID=UPI001B320106|nr:RICIN domain-containing protein [Streptomyces sp. GESEQ-35]